MRITKPSIELIRPEWDAPENVEAFFTVRNGGVSSGPFGGADGFNGLNLGSRAGDYGFAVKANRGMVREFLPSDPKWLHQVHSTKVVDAETSEIDEEADGSVTDKDGVVCVVMTADCVPVLLCDKQGKAVASVHAGWRGLAEGVIQEGVRKLREKAGEDAEILAWIGPCIRKNSFEVGPDVIEIFQKGPLARKLPEALEDKGGDKWLLDLPMLAKEALTLSGVNEISDCGLCTAEDAARFYSYRRDGKTGRHGSFIFKR